MTRDESDDSPRSAANLTAELERDPEYQAQKVAKEEARLTRLAVNRENAAPVIAELARAGYVVSHVQGLLTSKQSLEAAVPILLAWLPKLTNVAVKESIVRTLAIPLAKPMAARPLIAEFRQTDDSALRGAIGNALEVVADDSVVDAMIELAQEARYGTSREMVVAGLGNMTDPRVVPVLLHLLTDGTMSAHAIAALGKLRCAAAANAIEPFLHHDKPHVRREAKQALAQIARGSHR